MSTKGVEDPKLLPISQKNQLAMKKLRQEDQSPGKAVDIRNLNMNQFISPNKADHSR